MAAIITEKFRQINAAQFEESFSETNENYYMFVGKSTPFTSGTSGGSDTSPPTPVDDITSENYRWDSMLGANAIAASDVSRGVPRRHIHLVLLTICTNITSVQLILQTKLVQVIFLILHFFS